jgi:prepilin-type processing-associated H-X9-DG protein
MKDLLRVYKEYKVYKVPAVFSGIQGLQGIQGASGIQGLQGIQGASGIQGLQGIQGASGIQGLQGIQGASGIQGLQGIQGASGIQGLQGIQGASGIQGLQGIQGASGIQGLQGIAGSGLSAGSANQVVYTNASNVASGSANFTFVDGSSGLAVNNNDIYFAGANNELIEFDAGDINIITTDGDTNIGNGSADIRLTASDFVYVEPALQVDNLKLDGNTLSSTNTNGNIVLSPDGTGNVGIGTTSPSDKLHVSGAIYLDSFSPGIATNRLYNTSGIPKFDGGTIVQSEPVTSGNEIRNMMVMTEEVYNNLGSYDSNTLYFLT